MNINTPSDKPGIYLVESSKKDKLYEVDPNKPFCNCPAYLFRARKTGGICKHILAVKESLQTKNKDIFETVLKHVKDHQPIDSIELIEQFGDEVVDELITQGELREQEGVIELLP